MYHRPALLLRFVPGVLNANPVPIAAAAFAQCITGARAGTTRVTVGGGVSILYIYE